MSRIIVKQLPKNINEEKLRNMFGSKGTITDMQLKYTPDGKFRQFCFIGYQTEEEAQQAVKFFNNTCIQTNRIKVETCAALGKDEKPQFRSKHSKDKKETAESKEETETNVEVSTKKKEKKNSKIDEIVGKHKDDPEFLEFMKVHDKSRTLWANDDLVPTAETTELEEESEDVNKAKHKASQVSNKDVEDNDEDVDDDDDDDDEDEGGEDNDDSDSGAKTKDSQTDAKLAEKPISDLEYMKSLMTNKDKNIKNKEKSKKAKSDMDLFTIKIHNVPYKVKRQEILKFFKPVKPFSVRLPTNVHGFCYVGFKSEKEMVKAMLKNKSFIKGKQVFFTDFTEKNKITKSKLTNENDNNNSTSATTNPKWLKQQESVRNEENISESGKIFFRNLAYTVTEEDLQQVFQKFGPVAEIHLPIDKLTRQIKGFGTVTFVMPEHAVLAFNQLDGTDFHGRLLHLIPGKSKEEEELNENDAGLSFKQKKMLKLKKMAQQSVSWNTLFLGSNAVANILAKQFGFSKETILDTSSGGSNAALRIALGETQIVMEMKKFLEENGVCLSAFDERTTKRSKTVILAKNLPADTTVAELKPLFINYGPIARLVLPPSGVTALIEFSDPSEARQAFKKLAYSKFKSVPLYLEWAPENSFKTTITGEPYKTEIDEKSTEIKTNENVATELETKEETVAEVEDKAEDEDLDNEDPEPNTTLFLRNLNFKTVQETVHKHFKNLGPIHTVEIAKRKDPENPRNVVSLGYGFIQFKKSATAEKALKQMQFTTIDDNQVELKRSDRTLKAPNQTARKKVNLTKQTGTKILVRNIPFQAKLKEVRDIFKTFGELRTVRLPMKMTPGENQHRGFGFVDFITKTDAKKAFDALSQSVHLYGRRLVLEWASITDEDVNELRKRTATQYNAGSTAVKRSKKAVFDTEGNIQTTPGDDEDI